MRSRAVLVAFVLAAEALAGAQQQQPRRTSPAADRFSAEATAILVDVVVRDKRGHPITDLTQDDFEIREDSVPQTLGSFSAVARATGIGIRVRRREPGTTTVTASAASPSSGALVQPSADTPTSALVFDALSPEGLGLAQKAALAELSSGSETGARLAVFAADPGLRVLQSITDDMDKVRLAVRRLSAVGTSREEAEVQRLVALNERIKQLDAMSGVVGLESGSAFVAGGDNSTLAQSIVEMQMATMETRMLRNFETLDRDHRGTGTAISLMRIIETLRFEPGRKTIVYFSEGLPASPSLQARLDAVVSAANRANVTLYAIDVAGLRSESALLETRREVDMAAEERLRQSGSSRDPTSGPLTRIVERTEDLLRLDKHSGLARLAEDTGGFLVRDTNDFGAAFRRIDEDARFHYMLTYSPSNQTFDGRFRRINVKVRRDGAQVYSRKGYFAVRSATAASSYEAPALAMLERAKLPNAFPVGAAALVFPSGAGNAAVPVVVRVRTSELEFRVDQPRDSYSAQAAVVVRFKNTGGQPVLTLSQQYILTGTMKELEVAKQGEILFYRQPNLPPGAYTVEAVVHDAIAERASARLSTIVVPAASAERLAASSLVIVRRAEKVTLADRAPDLPLYYEDRLLYPNTGEPLKRGTDTELAFYIAFHPAVSRGETEGFLDVLHNGRTLASSPLELPRATRSARVQYVGRLPIDDLPDGTLELRLRLRQRDDEQVRHAFVTITR